MSATRRPRLIEVEQKPDGRWVVTPSDASERLVIPGLVLDAVRRHAVEVNARARGHEAFGALVVGDDGRVLRYARLANPARTPGHVRIASARQLQRRPDGHALLPCHSHPRAAAVPSPRDVESAIRLRWRRFAIYSPLDGLRLWASTGDGGCREVAFDVS
jgi:proteasome lid subunit RPN8/RPN11